MIAYRGAEKQLENASTHVPVNDVQYCTVQAGVQSTRISSEHSGTTPVHSEQLGQHCSTEHLSAGNIKNSTAECNAPVQSTKVTNSLIYNTGKTSTHNLPCHAVQLREQTEHFVYDGEESTLKDQLTCNSVQTDSMQRNFTLKTQEMQCCAISTEMTLSQSSNKVPRYNSKLGASANDNRVQPRHFDPSCNHLNTSCTSSDNTDYCSVQQYNVQKQSSSHPSTVLKQENSK